MTQLQKIKAQIDSLPQGQRAKLVDYMLRQEDEITEAEAEKAWAPEIQARFEEFRHGRGRSYSADQVLKEARRKAR